MMPASCDEHGKILYDFVDLDYYIFHNSRREHSPRFVALAHNTIMGFAHYAILLKEALRKGVTRNTTPENAFKSSRGEV